jgi:hypothetical protein
LSFIKEVNKEIAGYVPAYLGYVPAYLGYGVMKHGYVGLFGIAG